MMGIKNFFKYRSDWTLYGDPGATRIVTGHSHRTALAQAKHLKDSTNKKWNNVSILAEKFNTPYLFPNDDYWETACKIAQKNQAKLVLLWDGNQINYDFLIAKDRIYLTYNFTQKDIIDEVVLLSSDQFKDYFKKLLAVSNFYNTIKLIKKNNISIELIPTPPPKPVSVSKSHIQIEPFYVEHLKNRDSNEIIFYPDKFRVYLWSLNQRIIQGECKILDITYRELPGYLFDNGGLLPIKYSNSDATHANVDYGEKLVDWINRAE